MSKNKPEPCGNENCDKCYPLPRFRIVTERVQRLFHTREIKAATEAEALAIYNGGTAWPASYDDRDGEILETHEPLITIVEPRDPRFVEAYDCFHSLRNADVAAFLQNPKDDL